jgi:salicylate hydroxylase
MLPFGGQGSNQAIEDGGALGQLLVNIHDPALIPKRLHLFQKLRKNRASRIQILSRVRVGNERQVESELRKYMDTLETGILFLFDYNIPLLHPIYVESVADRHT